uniref:Uncharacterized protein n=1 Tax=Ignavibacterium album TaxID=591197 RepID=A0A832DL96_9BACT
MTILNRLKSNLYNIPGWRTNRKILVIESDDWGSIRIPSNETYNKLKAMGIELESNPFNQYDSLETEEDLEALFQILKNYHDKNGNHPVVTANFAVANPDFNKIKESRFTEYFYEPITETYKRSKNCNNSLALIKKGIEEKVFCPQYHCREHLNVITWLKLLRNGRKDLLQAFDLETCGIDIKGLPANRQNLMAAYDYSDLPGLEFVLNSINDGVSIFKKIFGFEPHSSMAPSNLWDDVIESCLAANGIKFIQSYVVQKYPVNNSRIKRYRYTGQKNSYGQYYFVRNCYFEPSTNNNYDWLKECMQKISTSFLFRKPAIITTHRLNFIGTVFKENREKNLFLFDKLLKQITEEFPDVEFLNSVELGKIIQEI